MKSPSLRLILLLIGLCSVLTGIATAESYTFPSSNSFSCNTGGCTYLGDNGNQSEFMYSFGDFVTEIVFNGPDTIHKMQYDLFLIDNFGGNPGAKYVNDIFINGILVGTFLVPDCNFCGTTLELKDSFAFTPIVGNGTYALTIVLGETVPLGGGNEAFLAPGTVTLIPEPSTLSILGATGLVFGGLLRLKLFR